MTMAKFDGEVLYSIFEAKAWHHAGLLGQFRSLISNRWSRHIELDMSMCDIRHNRKLYYYPSYNLRTIIVHAVMMPST